MQIPSLDIWGHRRQERNPSVNLGSPPLPQDASVDERSIILVSHSILL